MNLNLTSKKQWLSLPPLILNIKRVLLIERAFSERKNNVFCALLRYINQLSFICLETPPLNPLGMLSAYFPSVLTWVCELTCPPQIRISIK